MFSITSNAFRSSCSVEWRRTILVGKNVRWRGFWPARGGEDTAKRRGRIFPSAAISVHAAELSIVDIPPQLAVTRSGTDWKGLVRVILTGGLSAYRKKQAGSLPKPGRFSAALWLFPAKREGCDCASIHRRARYPMCSLRAGQTCASRAASGSERILQKVTVRNLHPIDSMLI